MEPRAAQVLPQVTPTSDAGRALPVCRFGRGGLRARYNALASPSISVRERVRPFGLERTDAQYRPICFPHRGAPPRTSRTFVNGRTFEAHRVMLVATSGYIKGSLVGAGATIATVSTLDVRFPDAPSSDRARRAMRNSQHCRCGSGSRLKRRARGIIMNFRSSDP